MPFTRPSRADLIARAEADLASRLGLGALIRRSILKAWAAVVGGLSHRLHGHAVLERIGTLFGINRKPAAFATGNVTFTGTESSSVPVDTIVQRADGQRYKTTSAATIVSGTATAPVQAEEADETGNADQGTTLSPTSPISGIDTTATVATGGITGGVDREADADLLARIQTRLQTPPQGGSAADYIAWCLEVAGVTRAWAIPQHQGPGTVGITFVLDEATTIIPSASKVQEVADYLNERRPVTATLDVFAPGTVELTPTITITPDNADVRAAVAASLEDMLRVETEPGKELPVSKISEAISAATGEESHTLVAPTAPLQPLPGEIIVLGTITWT